MESIHLPVTLIIRFWHEETGSGKWLLRGSIEHVQSGERIYFHSTGDMKSKLFQIVEGFLPPINSNVSDKGEPE